ncbi:MAG: phospholipase D-like domain-containing protein [Lachnospiraceae bacterium]
MLEILKDKAAEGVEVRLMYDGTLQFASLSHDYPKRLEAAGIKCKVFSPIKPALTTYQNNRDHRKILVIDGETAFTGGTNLADEYINKGALRPLEGHRDHGEGRCGQELYDDVSAAVGSGRLRE